MFKVWVVARREYLALVTTKSFWLGLLIPPLLGLLMGVLALTGTEPDTAGPRTVVLVDPHGLAKGLHDLVGAEGFVVEVATPARDSEVQRAEWGARLQAGELAAVVELPPLSDNPPPIRVYVDNLAGSTARRLGQAVREAVRQERMRRVGLSEAQIGRLLEPVAVDTERIVTGRANSERPSAEVDMMFPLMTLIFTMMGVMSGAVPLLQAVVEEKQQRISEVLLGAVAPSQLMAGKLLGTTAAGASVLGCNLLLGLGVALEFGLVAYLPIHALAVACAIALLAMLMYGALFLALGAASTELKDAQGLLMPVMLLFLAPMAALPVIAESPNGWLAVALSLFPLTSPLTLPVRLSMIQMVPVWQVAASFVLIGGATAATVAAAGRVFRIGMLSPGKLPSLRELARWVARG